jgi:hypothetical protein
MAAHCTSKRLPVLLSTGIVKSAPFLEMSEQDFDAVVRLSVYTYRDRQWEGITGVCTLHAVPQARPHLPHQSIR